MYTVDLISQIQRMLKQYTALVYILHRALPCKQISVPEMRLVKVSVLLMQSLPMQKSLKITSYACYSTTAIFSTQYETTFDFGNHMKLISLSRITGHLLCLLVI